MHPRAATQSNRLSKLSLVTAAAVVAACMALTGCGADSKTAPSPQASSSLVISGGFASTQRAGPDGPTPGERKRVERRIERYRAAHPSGPTAFKPYPFFPQGGTLWQDLFVNNFVDLKPTSPAIGDFECEQKTYDLHEGHDSDILSFSEQKIGVPVFAALSGTVIDARDGEPDMNTELDAVPGNQVVIDHGGGQSSWYLHLKKNSAAVFVGQSVVAGQQIGLTGSSGRSSGPHLHFATQLHGAWIEPSAGACRPGPSRWVSQVPIRTELYVRDFMISPNPFDDSNAPPSDNIIRRGMWLTGARTMHLRAELSNLPANRTYRLRLVRPDSTVAGDFSGPVGKNYLVRKGWFAWQVNANLNQVGKWKVLLDINGATLVDAPFDVVASAKAQLVNRPPNAVSAALDPAAPKEGDVIFCRVQTSPITEDPDYDIVSYQYIWRLNGTRTPVRAHTFASLSDALASNMTKAGDVVSCVVVPSDGKAQGPAAFAKATVAHLGSPSQPKAPNSP